MTLSSQHATIQKTDNIVKKLHLASKALDIFEQIIFTALFVKLSPYTTWSLQADAKTRL